MKRINSQKGQALILIAFGIVALVGFTALAVDGGRIVSERRHAQNAADTAVLASALSKANGETTYKTKATERATSNGYTTGVNNRTVEVNLCSESGVTCTGLPAGAVTSEYIRVRITSIVSMTFGRVLGRQTVTNVVEAIARVQTSTSSGGGSFFNGSAMVATKMGNFNNCLLMNSNGKVTVHNSGIYINCEGDNAMVMNDGADLTMDAQGEVVGGLLPNGTHHFDPITWDANGGISKTINESTFAAVPKTDPKPTCSGNGNATPGTPVNQVTGSPPSVTVGNGNTITFSQGNFSSILVGANATAVFNPGVYCISGNFIFDSNSSGSGPSGRVLFVLQNGIIVNGGSNLDFNDLEFHTVNGSFTFNSGNPASLQADRLRFFSTGSGNFTINASNTVISQDAYFYFHSGNIVWNANSTLNLTSPKTGDYAGLLIHKPWSNEQQINFNGGTNIYLSGTFLAPNSVVDYNSAVAFELHSQIIASTFIINSGATLDIYYQADENYGAPPPTSPTIELTK